MNIQSIGSDTALIYALKKGHIRVAMALMDKEADVNIKGRDGLTALMIARTEGYSGVAIALKDKGAN